MVVFNSAYLKDGFTPLSIYFDTAVHTIVPAKHFYNTTQTLDNYQDKAVIGRLLSITTPDDKGTYFGGRSPMMAIRSGGARKPTKQPMGHNASALLLVFADYYDKPNCFCLFIRRKIDFQRLFGPEDITRSEIVQVGDVFAIKDPRPSGESLGESVTILRDPKIVAAVSRYGWPEQPLVTSTVANWQVFFNESAKQIRVFGPGIISQRFYCNGFTCDRQGPCKGCFGRAGTHKPMVLECDVTVLDVPQYSSATNTADFYRFTSLHFTKLFFRDFDSLTNAHVNAINGVRHDTIRAVQQIVDHVNNHGGWTISGWQRQGVRVEEVTGDDILNAHTSGHITLLEPTDQNLPDSPELRALQVPTPSDETVPAVPPAALPDGEQRDAAPRQQHAVRPTACGRAQGDDGGHSYSDSDNSTTVRRTSKRSRRTTAGEKVTGLDS